MSIHGIVSVISKIKSFLQFLLIFLVFYERRCCQFLLIKVSIFETIYVISAIYSSQEVFDEDE